MIIGTAGHIDHGKSALVEALTGQAMDRLREERERGITIDLNFAPLDLGEVRAGVVDVPGHEDFIRTMVAGSAGVDVVLLVVAADEGVMPQTREHLAIVEQLGIPRGIPVITKCDLADAGWIDMVEEDLRERVAASPVRFEAAHRVSVRDGRGLDALRAALGCLQGVRSRDGDDLLRLPVDRTFTVAGTGTVVTGTLWSGTVKVGDAVRLLPSDRRGRVRTVQSHGQDTERGLPGQRVAVGLAGVTRDGLGRGETLVRGDDPWSSTTVLDVYLRLLPDAPAVLRPRTRVRLHLGTAEVMARVSPRSTIPPGGGGLARLRLESPVACRGGDRFVLRSYSPVTTIGGGRVLDPLSSRELRVWPGGLDADDPLPRLVALLARRRHGAALADLPVLLGVPADQVRTVAAQAGTVVGDRVVSADRLSAHVEDAVRRVDAWHRDHPDRPGIPLETLRQALRTLPALAQAAIHAAQDRGSLSVTGPVAHRPDHGARVPGGEARLQRLLGAIREGGLTPPSLSDLGSQGDGVEGALRVAEARGAVTRVDAEHFYAPEALESWTQALIEAGGEGDITPAALRERLGLSRKFLIPLLEWSDRTGRTRRIGERRVLVAPLSRDPAEI